MLIYFITSKKCELRECFEQLPSNISKRELENGTIVASFEYNTIYMVLLPILTNPQTCAQDVKSRKQYIDSCIKDLLDSDDEFMNKTDIKIRLILHASDLGTSDTGLVKRETISCYSESVILYRSEPEDNIYFLLTDYDYDEEFFNELNNCFE